MIIGVHTKQPSEKEDYDIDYREWLTEGDNVLDANVSVSPSGLTVESVYILDPRVKIWLSGGDSGVTYKVTVVVNTADGRIKEVEFKVKVKDS